MLFVGRRGLATLSYLFAPGRGRLSQSVRSSQGSAPQLKTRFTWDFSNRSPRGPGRPVLPVLARRRLPTQLQTREGGRSPSPSSFPFLKSLLYFSTRHSPSRGKQGTSTAAGPARSPAPRVKLFNPKHKHQPLTCFKQRHSWMTAEPKQTEWGGKKGKQLAQLGWRSGSCYTPFAS